ncbi:uncharacterized protein LOC111643048, partial [Copidosoma floridanum]|uniref:uncharacterized protein LOC111643048 n=1 Tax=Copidosoma floridanum TaxID=29053 RepID=UPI000C6FB84F
VVGPGGQVIGGQQQGGVVIGGDDGSDSQAISSVKQSEAGTQASATAEGKHGQGSAKSQVSGTYTGSGSFSAQAGTSDATKSAQTQVSGGKEGAKSSSQGSGGLGKSQTQVELDSDTGATSTNAQSSGWNHGTNSQVQASGKGGMADAQANGEGQTSSQAQIGFQPYVNRNEKVERLEKPFRGGGTASAQSGTFRGQSQSQLQGSFHYGITYSGAAQAGSGSGAAALRKPFNFTNNDSSLFKPFKFDNNNNKKEEKVETTTEIVPKEQLQGSSSRQTVIAITSRNGQVDKKNYKAEAPPQPYENEDEYEEYEDEEYTAEANRKATTSVAPQTTKQTMRVVTDGEYDVSVKHEESTTEEANGHSLPGYVAHRDSGHRGKIASVAGRRTIAQGDGRAQSQTVSLVPVNRTTGKPAVSDTRSLTTRPTDRVGGIYYGGMKAFTDAQETTPKTSYVSVSNSVAGKMDDKSEVKKYEHRYYTKSSTCGYFTFSCNVVYGSNGRRKICKPKMPTNADGTPKC